MTSTLIASVVLGIALSLISAIALFFYPGIIMIMPAGQENQLQQTTIQQNVSTGYGEYEQVNVTVNGQVLIADISATPEQRTRGLSVKDSLAQDEAMLFVFDDEARHRFWMKDMKFPIDIIWIRSDKTVVDVEHDLQPCNLGVLCTTYEPDDDSLYVLETVSGFAQKHGIVEGSPVEFDLNPQSIS
jgi:uncharacterized membrane protein (UPF0127 family)